MDLVTQLQTLVSDAQAALSAAQASPATVNPNDGIVSNIVAVFTNAGYTVTPPPAEPSSPAVTSIPVTTPEDESAPDEASTDTSTEA